MTDATKPTKGPGKRELTVDRVRELLAYDSETGNLIWKMALCNRIKVGSVAGSANGDGYLQITVDGHRCRVHRLVWFLAYGLWPAEQLDHINGIRDDNRLENLREANNSENGQNRAVQRNNRARHPGVRFDPSAGKWRARIQIQGRKSYLGAFDRIEDAVAARQAAKIQLHAFQPFDRGSNP